MAQTWHDLLFAHWPVPPEMLRATIPASLALDTFQGQAWVGVVPFGMRGVRPRGLPPLPRFSAFPELNVRTYVTAPGGEKPGVYFYSLDAGNPLAVAGARLVYHLPYFYARMGLRRVSQWVSYSSRRSHPGAAPGNFVGQYRPNGPVFRSARGSLEEWLTERYCLYAVDRRGAAYRGDIHHVPWPLQPAEAELHFDVLITQHGIRLPDTAPLLHFARRLTMAAWMLDPVA